MKTQRNNVINNVTTDRRDMLRTKVHVRFTAAAAAAAPRRIGGWPGNNTWHFRCIIVLSLVPPREAMLPSLIVFCESTYYSEVDMNQTRLCCHCVILTFTTAVQQ